MWNFLCVKGGLALPMPLTGVPAWERAALVDFYHATGGGRWRNTSGWLSGDPCANRWYGIFCDADRSHVTSVFPNPRAHALGTQVTDTAVILPIHA